MLAILWRHNYSIFNMEVELGRGKLENLDQKESIQKSSLRSGKLTLYKSLWASENQRC